MKNVFILTIIILACSLLLISPEALAKKVNNGPMTLQVTESTSINMNVPETWSVSRDKRNYFLFNNLKAPKKIDISLANIAVDYSDDNYRIQITEKSKNGSHAGILKHSTSQTKVERVDGTDNILGQEIPWGMWTVTHGNETFYLKSLYPFNGKKVFIIFVTFKEGAPFDQAEALIEELVSAIQKSGS